MKKILKRVTGIFLCVAMAAGIYGAVPAYAEGTDAGADIQTQAAQWPAGPEVQAASAIIMDASTGTVLYEKDADTPRYPASITKIMTTLLHWKTAVSTRWCIFPRRLYMKTRAVRPISPEIWMRK